MKQLLRFTIISTKLFFRNREGIAWNFIFPVFLFIIYVTIFSGMYVHGSTKEQGAADSLAKILAINFMSGGIFSLGITLTALKERGILRRYKVTPVRPITIVVGMVFRHYFYMLLVTTALMLLAVVLYHARLAGSALDWFLISSLGIFVFCSLGFCMAGICRTVQGAVGVGNLFFMPMLFLSGATLPAFLFPQWLLKVSSLLPSYHLNNLLQGVLYKGTALTAQLSSILVLTGFGVAFVILAAIFFRWD